MLDRRGQANVIVMIGMVAATVFVLFNAFNYISSVGLSSTIEITAQNSIYQTLAERDYLTQQAAYLFDEAQLFDAFSLIPTVTSGPGAVLSHIPFTQLVSCGYINATTALPFIPTSKVYYWNNLEGDTCVPNNQEIVYGLTQLLNESQFATVNASGLNIESFLDLNFTKQNNGIFQTHFTAPYSNSTYLITYNPSATANNSIQVSYGGYPVFSGNIGSIINLNGSTFETLPPSDEILGVLSQAVATSSFFARDTSAISQLPNTVQTVSANSAEFALTTFSNGVTAVVYDDQFTNATGTYHTFYVTPLKNANVYDIYQGMVEDQNAGVNPQIGVFNNTPFEFGGAWYTFTVTKYPNGIFSIVPVNYTIIPLQPQFVYYKYLINEFDVSQSENLLFPNYKPLHVSVSLFPLYNPQVCISYNEVQFTLQNCISVSGYITGTDYISQLMQLGVAFVNESFPLGNLNITGFAQYSLYNYLENTVHAVNLETVSVNGIPKYDWYSALMLTLGSPQYGASYLINQLKRVEFPYYGTEIYNCSYNSSDLKFCQNLLSQTINANLQALFNEQIPEEISFLSGTAFNVNVLNLSASVKESDSCPSYGGAPASDYNATVNYAFAIKSPTGTFNLSNDSETLGIPISINFAYQNELKLVPTEACGIQNNPYEDGYPGFTQTLVTSTGETYLNCAPVIANTFLNDTCMASIETGSSSVMDYINASTKDCEQVKGTSYYYCANYKFDEFTSSTPSPYERWFTEANACPNYVVIDNENFTYAQSPTQYDLVSMYGGGTDNYKDTYLNWTFSAINGSMLNLPANFSINVGVTMSGPKPTFNLLLSSTQSLSSQFTVLQLSGSSNPDAIYNYSSFSGLEDLDSGRSSSATGVVDNLQANYYGTSSSGYNLGLLVNSIQEAQVSSKVHKLQIFGNPLRFIGFSTDEVPSQDNISYFFVNNYVENYNPIEQDYLYQPASGLNPDLIKSFGLTTENDTYYNLISLNATKFSNSYQLEIILDNNYNYNFLYPNFIEVFGVYNSSDIVQFSWWNQTPIGTGSVFWVNVTKNVPPAIYIVYGAGAFNTGEYDDVGISVFPIFFSDGSTLKTKITYNYSETKSNKPEMVNGNLELTKTGPVAPYIYNSTISAYYGQFACITIKPNLSITFFNATYSPYSPQFNINSLYSAYNPLYSNLKIIGTAKTYTSWASIGT